MAYFADGTYGVITDYTVSNDDPTPGEKTVTVSYDGVQATFTVKVVAAGAFAGGKGMESDPFLIRTEKQLAMIEDLPGRVHFRLVNNVTLTKTWDPIGSESSPFLGVFDGNGFTISGLKTDADENNGYFSLFGYNSGEIKNLNLTNVKIASTVRLGSSTSCSLGGVAAQNAGMIRNCEVTGEISMTLSSIDKGDGVVAQVGGIVGMNRGGMISECTNNSTVLITGEEPNNGQGSAYTIMLVYCGGIVGYAAPDSVIEKNQNHGSVKSALSMGDCDIDIDIDIMSEKDMFQKYRNRLALTHYYFCWMNIGGIAGGSSQCTIQECYNTGEVIGDLQNVAFANEANFDYSIGGIVGYAAAQSVIYNCYNAGSVSYVGGQACTAVEVGGCFTVFEYKGYQVSGISGSRFLDHTVKCCYNIGELNNEIEDPSEISYDGTEINCYSGTDSAMQLQSTYKGFDFAFVWVMSDDEEYPYPVLRELTVSLTAISVAQLPSQLTCLEGRETLNTSGGELNLQYDDGSIESIPITTDMVSGFDNTKVGKQTLTVTYKGIQTTYTVTIRSKSVERIQVSEKPEKLSYLEGKDALSVYGGKLLVTYDNGTSNEITITTDMVSGFDNTKVGKQALTVIYKGLQTTYTVTIRSKSVERIQVSEKPEKLSYLEGKDALSVYGGKLLVTYDNGTSNEITITTDMVSGFDNTKVGKQALTVSYEGKNASYEIEVVAKKLAKLELTRKPDQLTYTEGDELTLSGLVVTAVYDNGTSSSVTDYEISGYDSTAGRKAVKVTFGGMSVTFDVTVEAGECQGDSKCPTKHFTDVSGPGNWLHEGIDYAVANGLFNGISKTEFKPGNSMTRGMLVTVLWRMEGSPSAEGLTNSFPDVPAGKYYTTAVLWASANSVVNGTGAGKFSPDNNVTREQMAAILYRYSEYKGYDRSASAALNTFPDADKVAGWASDALSWANGAGLITGTKSGEQTLLNPKGNATRAQVATILMRFQQSLVK